MNAIPLWVLYTITSVIVLLSIELGWRLGNHRRQRFEEEKKAPIGAAVGATLGLLAFLLAFTFDMAATRNYARKQIVLDEANAILTTYLRADYLSEPSRDDTRNLLREYTALRAGGADAIMPAEGRAKSAALHDRLWAIADGAGKISNTETTALFIESLNEVIELDASRVRAIRNTIPDSIWFMLYVVTLFSMATLGYEIGLTGARSWVVRILLMIVFTTVITLIADLDRPQEGIVQVSQQPLIDLLQKIGTPTP
jgi:hypothetical protein